MATPEVLRANKKQFSEMVALPGGGHKLILAAKALRENYAELSDDEKPELLEWVKLVSGMDTFITGEDQSYYTRVAVVKKGLRRANLEHLTRYTSEEVGNIEDDDESEYIFNIWKSELPYILTFLKQYEIEFRIVQ